MAHGRRSERGRDLSRISTADHADGATAQSRGMKLDRLLLSTVLVMLAPAAARAGHEDPSTVLDAYTQLRDEGCDVSQLGSPIAVRALRNVPYAQQGKIFKSAELTYLYEHDGGWYKPSDAGADVATADDRACVRKLDEQEKKLRKRVKLKKPIEEAVTRHTGAVLDMARLVFADFKTFRQSDKARGGARVWTLEFEAGGGAALVTVECKLPEADAKAKPPAWAKLECHVLAAG